MSENIMYKNIADKMKAQQQRIEYLERSNNRREDTILELRQAIAEQEDYKSRCEKAAEYINNNPLYETTYDYNVEEELEIQNVSDETASNDLLNILNGRSDK